MLTHRRLSAGFPVFIGLSGPDGAGKSSQAGRLATSLETRGASVVVCYVYGCPLCRRTSPSGMNLLGGRTLTATSPIRRHIHAAVDATDLARRLALAGFAAWLRCRRHGSIPIVVTDRSPVDGLIRYHGLRPGPVTAMFKAALQCYRWVAVLDAPGAVLHPRDREHTAEEIEKQRELFAGWTLCPNVLVIDAARDPDAITDELLHCGPSPVST